MTEPPRPPGDGNPDEPTTPYNPYAGNEPPPPPPAYGSPAPGSGAGGYAPPPPSGPGGYPPPSGPPSGPPHGQPQYGPPQYGPPQYGQQPPQYPAADDKTWVLVSHFGGAGLAFISVGVLGWVAPLVVMLTRGAQSPFVRAEAIKALNFQILWSIVTVVCWLLACAVIGFFLAPIAVLVEIIFGIVAGVKASNNEPYNYPLSYNIIK